MIANSKRAFRRHLGPALQRLGYVTGLMHMGRGRPSSGGAIVLMYHSVAESDLARWIDPSNHVPVDVFEKQMEFLARQKKVVSLGELVSTLSRRESPQDDTVVITFDDGYLDNLTVAAPILDHYRLPATVFLPTGYIDRGETQWIDKAYSCFTFRTVSELQWGKTEPSIYDLDKPVQYAAAYRAVCSELLSTTAESRRMLLDELRLSLKPDSEPPRLGMNWTDVRNLVTAHRCFEVGGHSLEHTDLTSVPEPEAAQEIAGCARRIQDELGSAPRHFSFCYGRSSERLQQLVSSAGFDAAFGACGIAPVINDSSDLLNLPRVESPHSLRNFDIAVSSSNTAFWRRLAG